MRLRGLPCELNCGFVDLVPQKDCPLATHFRTCSSCDLTFVKYYRLDCSHIHCENCLVFHDSLEKPRVECTVCMEVRLATKQEAPLAALYIARFECPCGEEGNLHHLSRHRRSCRRTRRKQLSLDLDSSQASTSSSTSSQVSSSSSASGIVKAKIPRNEIELPKSIEFLVKSYVAHEVSRMKEDIINTTREERQDSEVTMQRAVDRIDYLDSRLDHFSTLETRLERLETASSLTRPDAGLSTRLDNLDLQMAAIRSGNLFKAHARQQFFRLQSSCSFLWFDIKSLLRDFNRNRSQTATSDQVLAIGGFPCKLNVQIETPEAESSKMLVLYLGLSEDLTLSANWPMRRLLQFKIIDTHGNGVFENYFATTEAACREYFKGPGSQMFGTYYGVDLCSIEELTVENFYQRNNGMICLGILAGPCNGEQ